MADSHKVFLINRRMNLVKFFRVNTLISKTIRARDNQFGENMLYILFTASVN